MNVFGLLNNRMNLLRKSLEAMTVPINIIGKNEVAPKVRLVRNAFRYYSNLLDNLDSVNHCVQYSLSVTLLLKFPKAVLLCYDSIKTYFVKIDNNFAMDIVDPTEIILSIVVMSFPAMLCEMITNEVEKIKAILTKHLIQCSDNSLRFELNITLLYICHRPFKYILWRAIPLDTSVPIGIVSLIITYVIVLIQLLHFSTYGFKQIPLYTKRLTVTCLCHVPKIICYVYFVITVIYKSKFSGYNLVPLFDMILACMAVTAPAVFAELTKNTVDKIKKILGSQLLRCSDESLRYELEITLEYVIQRPFSFSIWRAVSLDASLPVAMTSLCITYVIVILQLTQLRP
ncbi:uncharacterized protein LOC134199108 [Bombyx mori]|uniref:uncharacterized protein LOC134199108 n=1 Tax=Bombyx mori TaxID=7091 RepID=UPI002ED34F42